MSLRKLQFVESTEFDDTEEAPLPVLYVPSQPLLPYDAAFLRNLMDSHLWLCEEDARVGPCQETTESLFCWVCAGQGHSGAECELRMHAAGSQEPHEQHD